MNHGDTMRALARRALQHLGDGTTDLAESTLSMPLEAYTDESRYRLEVERVFRHLPLAVALSVEVPEPGSYCALTVLELPLLIVRGRDLQVRAFLNVCRHRGSRLCRDGSGKVRVLTCP
jgi:phenylpropionate dioxygenase-like ring-hydroxylating dioxygenase large terminal subunit